MSMQTRGEVQQFHVILLGIVSIVSFFATEYFIPKVKECVTSLEIPLSL